MQETRGLHKNSVLVGEAEYLDRSLALSMVRHSHGIAILEGVFILVALIPIRV